MITEVHQEGRFYRLSTGRAVHCENIRPHNPSTGVYRRHGRGRLTDDGSCLRGQREGHQGKERWK